VQPTFLSKRSPHLRHSDNNFQKLSHEQMTELWVVPPNEQQKTISQFGIINPPNSTQSFYQKSVMYCNFPPFLNANFPFIVLLFSDYAALHVKRHATPTFLILAS